MCATCALPSYYSKCLFYAFHDFKIRYSLSIILLTISDARGNEIDSEDMNVKK